jgi:hypothetical protein
MKGKRDWTIDENREMNRLDKSKSDILNNIIFPSMANLTVFLEGIAENKELQKVFDDDLKQLLLGRKITIEIDKETKDKKKRFGPIVFQRFIRAAITWNYREKTKNENESEYEYESEKDREKRINNFRLILIDCLEYILYQHLTSIGSNLLDSLTVNFFLQHLSGALAFTKLLSRNVNKDTDMDIEDASRPVNF